MKNTGLNLKNKAAVLLSRFNKVTALIIALAVVIVGYTIFATFAAGSFVAIEPENATLAGGTTAGNDTTASNGKYVQLAPATAGSGSDGYKGIYAITQAQDFSASVYDLDITGFAIRSYWKDIEPQRGQYNWSKFDNVVAKAKEKGKKVKLFVLFGVGVPDWVGTKWFTGSSTSPCDSANTRIPVPWDTTLLQEEKTFIDAFAARYRNEPAVSFFTMAGPSAKWAELCLPDNTVDQAGYSNAAILDAWKQIVDKWNSVRGTKHLASSLSAPPAFYTKLGDDLGNYEISVIGKDNLAVQWNYLDMKFANAVKTVTPTWAAKTTAGWQFWGTTVWPDRMTTDYEGSMRLAMDYGASYIEVYDDDLRIASLGAIAEQINTELVGSGGSGTPASTATATVNIPAAGSYKVWSRIMAPDTTNNSYTLQVDSTAATTVGDTAIPANTWTWVSGPTTGSLSQGNHTLKLTGRETGVKIDRLILTTDTACTPTGTGDNCVSSGDTVSPAVSITSPTAGTTVSGTVSVSATASDAVGVTKVEFYVDGALKSTDTTSPYSYSWNTTTIASGSHTLQVKAYDAANNIGSSSTINVTVNNADTQAPSIPTNLGSSSQTSSTIYLSWTASTDNVGVTGYRVYRNGIQVATTTSTAYTDSGLTASTAYSYRVSAYDAAGNASEQSAAITANTKAAADTIAPSTPTNLAASNVKYNSVTLGWTASTDNVGVVKYLVQRGGVTIAEPTTTAYTDTTVAANTHYSYVVRAVDAAGNTSAASNTQTVTTPTTPDTAAPSAPSSLTATAVSSSQINLAWAATTDNIGVTGYQIYRDGVQVGTSATTSYGDTGLTANTAYTYTVKAYDAAGNVSAASAATTATTFNTTGGLTGNSGVWADYYANTTLSGLPATSQQEGQVNYDWASAAPIAGVPADNFSVRWTGRVSVPTSGSYTFYTSSDDGVRLWVNDQLIIDDWNDQSATENKATVSLNSGYYNVRLEYFERSGVASAKLLWSGPNISKQVIRQAALLPQQYGLTGSYYSDKSLTNFAFKRLDSTLDFNWALGSPDTTLASNNFSVRWTGQVYVHNTGTYTFYTSSDDGVRLWVNGKQLINNWTNHAATENSGTIALTGGLRYNITVEYYEDRGDATAQLQWSGPSVNKQIIPKKSLRDRW